MPQIVAFAGPAGPFFLFLPFFFPPVLSPAWMGLVFSHPGSPLSRIRPQLPHTPPTGPVWGFGGVASLPRPLTGQKPPHRAEFGFSPQNEITPPPKGGGAGYHLSWVRWVCPARSQPGHSGPTGPVWAFAGVVSLPVPKNRTQRHTGPSLVLIAFSCCALGLAGLTSPSPACNSPPPGWAGW